MIVLRSKRLRVELPEPGEAPNDTHRFDRAGYVSDVVLDGHIHFCASEPRNLSHPSSGGRGLCSEFKGDWAREVEVGSYFLKPGVGLLCKEDDRDYLLHRKYREIVPFPVTFRAEESTAEFTVEQDARDGYALRIIRRVEVWDDRIDMRTELYNAGSRALRMVEYCHNFISIDGMALSEGYRWESPQFVQEPGAAVTDPQGRRVPANRIEHGFRFEQTRETAFGFRIAPEALLPGEGFDWRLRNDDARAFVEVHESFLPEGIQIWCSDHIVCPEVFYPIHAAPGETCRWARQYRFGSYE